MTLLLFRSVFDPFILTLYVYTVYCILSYIFLEELLCCFNFYLLLEFMKSLFQYLPKILVFLYESE